MTHELSDMVNRARIGKAARGVGSFLVFDFYEDLASSERELYHLWIYLADWTISLNSLSLLDSQEQNDAAFEQLLDQFIGCQITRVVKSESNIVMSFDDQYVVELCPNLDFYEATDELFMFFDRRENTILSYSPAAGLVLE